MTTIRWIMILACLAALVIHATPVLASPANPKLPSTLNFQALNVVREPTAEADWQFEIDRLDLVVGSDHMAGLRARGSDMCLLEYQLLHTVLISDTAELNDLTAFFASKSADVEDAFLHYYDNSTVSYENGAAETIPGWGGGTASTRKAARVKINIWGSYRYGYNLKNALVREFKGNQWRKILTGSALKYDGIFIDETSGMGDLFPRATSGGRIVEYANRTVPQANADYIVDVGAACSVINGIMGAKATGGDYLLLPNVATYVQFVDIAHNSDGYVTEIWVQEIEPRSPYTYDVAKQHADAGKIFVITQGTYEPMVNSAGNYNSAMDRHQMFGLCEYWVARQGKSTYYGQFPSDYVLLKEFWCKAREFDIGQPVDSLYTTWQSGTDSAGQDFKIYKREYSKAVVLSRPRLGWSYSDYSTRSPLYDLGGAYKLLHSDGTLGPEITKIGLSMGEAVALVRTGSAPPPSPSDTIPPVISGVITNALTANSATITWTTDEPASGIVDYGTTASYGSSATASGVATSQSITLSGLVAGTTYHYRVSATDAAGNKRTSTDYAFTTAAPGGGSSSSAFIRRWAVLGAFAFQGTAGHATDYIGEAAVRPSVGTVTAGKTWTDHTSTEDCVDFTGLFTNCDYNVVYAGCWVNSPGQKACVFRSGSDDGLKVWVNGTLVNDLALLRSATADEDAVSITLNAGWNRILCKVDNAAEAWRLYGRISDSEGGIVPGLTYQVTDPAPPVVPAPKITVTIAANKTMAKPGESITYTVTYKNTGTAVATSAVVSAAVDPNVNYVSASGTGSFDSASRQVKWNIGTVAVGASGTRSYTVTVK